MGVPVPLPDSLIDPGKWYCTTVMAFRPHVPLPPCHMDAFVEYRHCCIEGQDIIDWITANHECQFDPDTELCVFTHFSTQMLTDVSLPFDNVNICIDNCIADMPAD